MSGSRRQALRIALGLAIGPALGSAAGPESRRPGRIYLTTTPTPVDEGEPIASAVAIDPETGESTRVLDACQSRPRVSPDGRRIAFVRGQALWVRPIEPGAEATKVLDRGDDAAGSPPAWSGDGSRLILSLGTHGGERWSFRTVRVGADGTGRESLPIPPEDGVHDWSADGEWLVTASSRNARIGWELSVIRPDGTGLRQITEGGNPFYARFSPDGRQVLYSDGTSEERRGIWVVGVDGRDRRQVFATGPTSASACWSPDGRRIAAVVRDDDALRADRPGFRIAVMDLDGGNRVTIPLDRAMTSDMPDWR